LQIQISFKCFTK